MNVRDWPWASEGSFESAINGDADSDAARLGDESRSFFRWDPD